MEITKRIGMRNKLLMVWLALLGVLLLAASCEKPKVYASVPIIEYVDLDIRDTLNTYGELLGLNFNLHFKVVDGNGDIGIFPTDTANARHPDSLHHFNFFSTIYQMVDGELKPYQTISESAPDSTPDFNFRTPYFEPEGINKTLKADIYVGYPTLYVKHFKYLPDTMMIEFHVYDRGFNKSNVASTPILVVTR